MNDREAFRNWIAIGVPALLVIGFAAGIALHFVTGGVPWADLAAPVVAFVGVQEGVFIAMFWAGKRARSRNDYTGAVVLAGLYCWATGLLVMHYGSKFGFWSHHVRSDYFGFSIFTGIATVLTSALLLLRK